MTSVVDVWRATDPDARILSGSAAGLTRAVRTVVRTRVAPPHLPEVPDATLLVVDASLVTAETPLDRLLDSLRLADFSPVAVLLGGTGATAPEPPHGAMPVLVSTAPSGQLAEAAATYLASPTGWLDRLRLELRLHCAEATLADPQVGTAAGLVAARMRRGVAVSAEGELLALHARTAGRALAARFVALHARLLAAAGTRRGPLVSHRHRLWLLERPVRAGASVWLFDDQPLAAADEAAADALALTLRALMRRRPSEPHDSRPAPASVPQGTAPGERPFAETLLAVARNNGRLAPAARSLGVHRNTILYRLRRARALTGLDPRRPDDAIRILRDAD